MLVILLYTFFKHKIKWHPSSDHPLIYIMGENASCFSFWIHSFFVIHKYLGFLNKYVWQILDEFRQNIILVIELRH